MPNVKDNVVRLAVSKAVKESVEKKARENVAPGVYDVDATIRIRGTIRKGEDYEKDQPHRVKWDLLFAVLASKVNDETLNAVLRDYAGMGDDEGKGMLSQVKGKVEGIVVDLKGSTRAIVNGPITTDLGFEILAEKVKAGPLEK